MHLNCRILALAIACLPLAASAQRKDLLSDDERWEWAAGSSDVGAPRTYLRSYPQGRHAAEARARLQAFDNKPLARLSTDTPECRKLLQDRVRSMLDQPVAREHMASYDFTVAGADALLTRPSITFVPKGQTLESAPLEDRVTLNLIANRRGECVVMQRWSHGSGLPRQCGCAPVDPAHDFGPPPLAVGILKDQARMQAGAAVCRREFERDHGDDLPQKYLDLRIELGRELVSAMLARQAGGKALFPTEQDELQSWRESLPVLAQARRDELTYEQELGRLGGRPRAELERFCGQFAERIQNLMTGLMLSAKMRR